MTDPGSALHHFYARNFHSHQLHSIQMNQTLERIKMNHQYNNTWCFKAGIVVDFGKKST